MQSGPHGQPLLVTGQSHPRGWSSGHLLESGLSICLHEIDTPVAALQDASESDIHVFFSGETEGAIPWAVDGWQSLEKQVTEAGESGSGRLLLRPHHDMYWPMRPPAVTGSSRESQSRRFARLRCPRLPSLWIRCWNPIRTISSDSSSSSESRPEW